MIRLIRLSLFRIRITNVLLAAGICTSGLGGCSNAEPNRVPIRGVVTLDGKPISDASIIFTPRGVGLAAAALIEDGQYSLTREDGPTVGDFSVRINPSEAEIEDADAASLAQSNRKPRIPKEYQREGKLSVTIIDQPDQQFDFKLLSRSGAGG